MRIDQNIAAVVQSIEDDAKVLIRRRSQLVGLCPSTTWKILLQNLGLHAYQKQPVHELEANNHRLRRILAHRRHLKLIQDEHFYQRIVFTDVAHLWLNDYVNKQNCHMCFKINCLVRFRSWRHHQYLFLSK